METVKLGKYVLPVVPQKHARLRHKLKSGDLSRLFNGEFYSEEAYRLLSIFIPQLPKEMPEWEFDGYASEEAQKNGDYDEEKDNSPDTMQIVEAFEKAIMVGGASKMGKLLALVQTGLDAAKQSQTPISQTPDSPDSPGNTGASPSMSSGTTAPITTPSAG